MKQIKKIAVLFFAIMMMAVSVYAFNSTRSLKEIEADIRSLQKKVYDTELALKKEGSQSPDAYKKISLELETYKNQLSRFRMEKNDALIASKESQLRVLTESSNKKQSTKSQRPSSGIKSASTDVSQNQDNSNATIKEMDFIQAIPERDHYEVRDSITVSYPPNNTILILVYDGNGGLKVKGRFDTGAIYVDRFSLRDTSLYHIYVPMRRMNEERKSYPLYPVIAFGNSGRLWIMQRTDKQRIRFAISNFKHLQKIEAVTCDSAYKNIMVLGTFDTTQLLYRSNDAGNTWNLMPVVYSQRTLSRGVVMAGAITGGLFGLTLFCILWLYFRRRKLMTEYESTIYRRPENELRISHDAPITEVKDDLLDFRATAEAIAGLMRNPDTIPPMTIVLSGSWGSGKSSLMGMIKEQLPKERFTSLWFNAWHLQGETSMLATFILSLMNGIKNDYGIAFKAILFKNRLFGMSLGKQFRFWMAMGVLFPLAILGVLKLLQPLIAIKDLISLPLLGLYGSIFDYACSEIMKDGTNTTGNVIAGILTTVTSVAGILFLQKDTPRFIGSFINLLPVDDFKMTTTQQPPGYREQFKKEFWEVVRASNLDRRIVVFIDDLDRVEGGRVLEILETINFITDIASRPENFSDTKSNLFFVMAMATEEVAKNVGAQLEAVYDSEGKKDLVLTGSRFLEKMVQLTIAVPTMNAKGNKFISRMVIRDEEEVTKSKRKSSKPEKEENHEE